MDKILEDVKNIILKRITAEEDVQIHPTQVHVQPSYYPMMIGALFGGRIIRSGFKSVFDSSHCVG
jgi:hypothetical protein